MKEPLLKNHGKDILWQVIGLFLFGVVWGVILVLFVQTSLRIFKY